MAAPQVASSPLSMHPAVSMELTGVVRHILYAPSSAVITSAISSIPFWTWALKATSTSSNISILAIGPVAAPMRFQELNCLPSLRASSRQRGRLKRAASDEL
ncbi:MAG: hypothetical protein BWY96_01404 [Spirochaetes bacterium ADurb.BinA120]|nr:MAG: hypothetical protein BWY96_01404 [Spirochaetes bacterium ADurb.BinA120]